MNFLDNLKADRISAASAFYEFLIDDPKYINYVFAFVEGHDDASFYYTPLSEYLQNSQRIRIYICKNKQEVYRTFAKIQDKNGIQNITLFFVDRDFSDLMGESYPQDRRIYTTDFYSIENHLTNEDTLLSLIMGTFQFPYDSDRIETSFFTDLYNREITKFYTLFLPIAAWMVSAKRRGKNPNLGNVKLSSIFSFSDDMEIKVSSNMTDIYKILEECCKIQSSVDDIVIQQTIEELETLNPKNYVRGKYELWFFIKFVDKLIAALEKSENLKVKTRISESTALSFLGPRAKTPASLVEFIHHNLSPLM